MRQKVHSGDAVSWILEEPVGYSWGQHYSGIGSHFCLFLVSYSNLFSSQVIIGASGVSFSYFGGVLIVL